MNDTSIISNGHSSPNAKMSYPNHETASDTASELSDIRDAPGPEASLSPSSSPAHHSQYGNDDAESSEQSEGDNDNGSDDGDFDMEQGVAEVDHRNQRIDRSSSRDFQRRPTKRKMGMEDDEYIKANPELYGLRRSVCLSTQLCRHFY